MKKTVSLLLLLCLSAGFINAQKMKKYILGGAISYSDTRQTFDGVSSTITQSFSGGVSLSYIYKYRYIIGSYAGYSRDFLSNTNQYIVSPHLLYAFSINDRLIYTPGIGLRWGMINSKGGGTDTLWGFGLNLISFEYMLTSSIGICLGNQIISYTSVKDGQTILNIGLFDNYSISVSYHF
ncbi:MAG: hypothetical protein GXZ19_02495 [Bacteroidales bacterium]|nr:hypothetical protein [Bacteroidales bacterium]